MDWLPGKGLGVAGYLCEIKDVQIRDGPHIRGRAPVGDELVNDVLAILRARRMFGGVTGALPGPRAALAVHFGLDEREPLAEPGAAAKAPDELISIVDIPSATGSHVVDLLESLARKLIRHGRVATPARSRRPSPVGEPAGHPGPPTRRLPGPGRRTASPT